VPVGKVYDCSENGKPTLHENLIELVIDRDISHSIKKRSDSLPTLLIGEDADTEFQQTEQQDVIQVTLICDLFI
jgi:hypothetical protein